MLYEYASQSAPPHAPIDLPAIPLATAMTKNPSPPAGTHLLYLGTSGLKWRNCAGAKYGATVAWELEREMTSSAGHSSGTAAVCAMPQLLRVAFPLMLGAAWRLPHKARTRLPNT
ncbi:uncharacterized protein B0I36DRAFT_312733 [Microdochium trichocladiopsis]|uniref:Uncharacterized protein n=1 Tax=Microdochium trichocladiopsis TaxID=1682393 RepID=A0A9P9BWG5_9PEZI|nr:uncharacterized protein B0I36DRAFT_312733 [Microdochium trichocladiopsis]KAH7041383.1 hypothetical protein B0I36DRAFT_312733 [Microdochium trichocladiopsis]